MQSQTGVVILGGHADEVVDQLPFSSFPLGYISEEHRIVDVYRAADVFVLPSLSENLPNTIMEAMACGVPCIGFKVGGIPEEIDHQKNGYVATYRDAADLARGLRWVLYESDHDALSSAAVAKVKRCYSQQSVALHYTELYNEAIAQKHYKL
jgi:glycosyltransferase involved in cell wall biosynthesis